MVPVCKRHLARHLDGCAPVVGEEDLGQIVGHQFDQTPRQLDGVGRGQPQQRAMCNAPELIDNRLIDVRMVVAVDVAPDACDPVDVLTSVGVDEHIAPAGHDHQRVGLVPQLVLRKRVPEVLVIPLLDLAGVGRRILGGLASHAISPGRWFRHVRPNSRRRCPG